MFEEAILFNSCFPGGELGDEIAQKFGHICRWNSDLLGSVKLTESDGIVLKRALINSDSEGNTTLVCASVALTNGVRAIVNLARDAGANKQFFYNREQGSKEVKDFEIIEGYLFLSLQKILAGITY